MRYLKLPVILLVSVLFLLMISFLFLPVAHRAVADAQPTRQFPRPFGVQLVTAFSNGEVGGGVLQDLGVTWVRVSLYWNVIEPTYHEPAVYNWAWSDQLFSRAAAEKVHVLVTIRENPTWAAAEKCGPIYPDKMARYQQFLQALVNRYKGPPYNVRYWEIMNEEDYVEHGPNVNLGGCFGEKNNDVDIWHDRRKLYVNILQAAYTAIKAADPDAQVLYGGVAHDFFYGYEKDGIFDPYFLDKTIGEYRGGDYFDIMNSHAYGEWAAGYWDVQPYPGHDVVKKLNYLRQQMREYNYPNKSIWFTETGIRSYSVDNPDFNTPQNQAAYVVKLFARLLSSGMDAPIFWFTLHDMPGHSDGSLWNAGLINQNNEKMPSYYAYKYMTHMMANAQYVGVTPDFGHTMEGYEYLLHGKRTWIIWWRKPKGSNYDGRFISVSEFLPLKKIDMLGHVEVIRDGGPGDLDGTVNGSIRLYMTGEPYYFQRYEEETPTPTSTATISPTATMTPTVTSTPTVGPSATSLPLHIYLPVCWRDIQQLAPTPTSTSMPVVTPTPTSEMNLFVPLVANWYV